MKKIAAILFALAVSTGAGAASVTVGYDSINGVDVPANKQQTSKQQAINLSVTEKINDNFTADVLVKTVVNNTNSSHGINGSRVEVGVTGGMPVFGPVSAYTRVALGQNFNTGNNFSFYSVEPGVAVVVPGITGLTAKVGYRFRDATGTANSDRSETTRFGLAYQLSTKDAVGFGYDHQHGNSSQNVVKLSYTRSF